MMHPANANEDVTRGSSQSRQTAGRRKISDELQLHLAFRVSSFASFSRKENVPSTVPITSPDQPPIPIRPCPREDNATMLDPDTPIALHIIPFFDVRTILTNSYEGRLIVESLDKDSFVTIKQRRCMIRILVSYLIEKFGETPSSETKKGLASALVQAFPCLHDKTASGYDTWYAQCRNNRPATGFIEERLRNIRKRLRRLRRPQGEKDNAPSRTVVPVESAISEERAEEIKQWLRNNTQPISQVEQYMRETALCRVQWIRANNSKNMFEVLHEFPRLTTTGMIAQDFHVLHQDAAPKLFEKWLPWYTDRILHFAEREAKLPCSVEEMTEDAKGNFALKLLPVLLPPPPYKIGRKTVRPSVDESKKAFIDIQPVGTSMVEYLQQAEASRPYPYVLSLENGHIDSQAFVILAGKALEQSTLIGAVDVCFKSFYVFDVNYPKQCFYCWEFIQNVYELEVDDKCGNGQFQ
ncbi:hypothetical protein ROHU_004056 [Labeo rohita]|uniref:Uncharacterized protein n=1 Tax=Labeo rohita TaxID=84645 RepID=A0A498NS55_LABRO|nr:hypothetical protein ROHU_004056 [Labeo rohita]